MNKPTCLQLIEELKLVHHEADDLWRHGYYIYEVFYREDDDTYWATNYRLSTDGETNELAEGVCDIYQVKPKKRIVIVYVSA